MAKTENNEPQPRIVGCTTRMGAEARVEPWKPQSEAEVTELPLPPARPARGWKVSAPASSHAAPGPPPAPALPPVEQEPQPTPRPRGPRPDHMEDGTLQAEIWEHPEDAARLIRTMLREDGQDPGVQDDGSAEAALLRQISPPQKVAIALLTLGEELTGEVFKHLSD